MATNQRNDKIMTRLQRKPKKKGYVRIQTNLGDLNIGEKRGRCLSKRKRKKGERFRPSRLVS